MQAIRFGYQSIRPYLARALRLLTVDVNARRSAEYIMDRIPNRTEEKDSMKDTTKDPHERVTDEEEKRKILTRLKDEDQYAQTLVDKYMQSVHRLQARHQQLHANAAEGLSSQTSTEKGGNSQKGSN